jgi:hypothetical protein
MLFLIMLFLIHGCPIPYLTFGMQILHPYQVRMAILRSQEEEEGDNTLMVGREREEEEKLKPVAFLRVYVHHVQLVRFRVYGTRECSSPISPALFHSLCVYV